MVQTLRRFFSADCAKATCCRLVTLKPPGRVIEPLIVGQYLIAPAFGTCEDLFSALHGVHCIQRYVLKYTVNRRQQDEFPT